MEQEAKIAEEEQKQEVQLQVQEEVLVICVSNGCAYSSSRSKIAAYVPIPTRYKNYMNLESIQKIQKKDVVLWEREVIKYGPNSKRGFKICSY